VTIAMKTSFLSEISAKSIGLGPRQIRVIASTETVDRVGDIVVMGGADLTAFRKNPIVLASHDYHQPIGTAKVEVKGGVLEAVITFAPSGVSKAADEWCGLAKNGVVNAVSIGFNPRKAEPIRGGGTKFTEWELLEISLVGIPANSSALVVERSHEKAGRVLSGSNKAKLTEAHEHVCAAVDALGEVLGAGADDNDGEDGDEEKRMTPEDIAWRRRANEAEHLALIYAAEEVKDRGDASMSERNRGNLSSEEYWRRRAEETQEVAKRIKREQEVLEYEEAQKNAFAHRQNPISTLLRGGVREVTVKMH
jgi:HK97 family phage prohead protease